MTDSFRPLIQTQLTTTAAVIYTSPATGSGIVKDLEVFNASAASATATFYINGSAAVNEFTEIPLDVRPGGATRQGNITLAGGNTLWAKASLASAVMVTGFGMEIT